MNEREDKNEEEDKRKEEYTCQNNFKIHECKLEIFNSFSQKPFP